MRDLELEAFFDVSGHRSSASRAFVVAGFGATASDWRTFSTAWPSVLQEAGIPELHMADVSAKKKKRFRDLDGHKYGALMLRLNDLLRRCAAMSFARVIEADDIARVLESGTTPFALAGVSILQAAHQWIANRNRRKYGGHRLTCVFDDGEKDKGTLLSGAFAAGFAQPVFAASINTPPLQAADWIAWELSNLNLRHVNNRGHGGQKLVKIRGTMYAAYKHLPHDWRYYRDGHWFNIIGRS